MLGGNENIKSFEQRLECIAGFLLFSVILLIYKLYVLQICYAEKYSLMSDNNRIRLSAIQPKRGKIISSDNMILASSSYYYKLVSEYNKKEFLKNNLDIISSMIQISEDEKNHLLNEKKSIYSPFVIRELLEWDEYAKVSMNLFKLNEIVIENSFMREYKIPLETCHVVGYVTRPDNNFQIPSGKIGLEAFFNKILSGKLGHLQTEINARGKKIRVLEKENAKDGDDLKISINSRLQKFIYDLLTPNLAGSAIVMDAKNGKILALVSYPGYDTNLFTKKISKEKWQEIINNPFTPLLNRAISAYPPGSIFKIVIAYAALCEKTISYQEKIFCSGGTKLDNHVFHCWNRYGHGFVNMKEALIYSCDCYFFELAYRMGIDTIEKYAKKLGFGQLTGIELLNESKGVMPSKKWKFLKYHSMWKPYETLLIGIGQGSMLATLLQSVVMFGKIFSNNYNFSATFFEKIFKKKPLDIEQNKLNVLKDALYKVCVYGTASKSCNASYGIYGKTGSSQVLSIKKNEVGLSQDLLKREHRDHAFFVGAAPYQDPKYIVGVFIEHGGGGAKVAAPIARKIFDKIIVEKILEEVREKK